MTSGDRLKQLESKVVVVAVHPGCVRTDFTRHMSAFMQIGNMLFAPIMYTLQKTRTQGAYSTLHALFDEAIEGGRVYFHGTLLRRVNPHINNEKDIQKLWDVSCELTGGALKLE